MYNYKLKNRKHIQSTKSEYDGIKFDSLVERDYYLILKSDPDVIHIDCHVVLTMAGGVRLNVDFIVYYNDSSIEVVEVKGVIKPDFKRLRQLFDETHPLGPMRVVQKKGKVWIEI